MFIIKFQFPEGNTILADVNSVPKVGEICRMENDSFSKHYRVGAVWHNIYPGAANIRKTSIDVILELP
jgi:hypothetical protein